MNGIMNSVYSHHDNEKKKEKRDNDFIQNDGDDDAVWDKNREDDWVRTRKGKKGC